MELDEHELTCSICKTVFGDPFVTSCGHTFCYACISQHLGQRNSCPTCTSYITLQSIFPNFILQRLASAAFASQRRKHAGVADQIHELLLASDAAAAKQNSDSSSTGNRHLLTEDDLGRLVVSLKARKAALRQRSAHANLQLLLHFLEYSREAKERKLEDLRLQLRTLDGDMSLVSSQLHGSRMLPAGSGGNLTEGLLSTETPQTQMPEDARADDQQGHAVDIANSNAYDSGMLEDLEDGAAMELRGASPDVHNAQTVGRELLNQAVGPMTQSVPIVANTHTQQPVALRARTGGIGNSVPRSASGNSIQHQDPLNEAALQCVVPPTPYFTRSSTDRAALPAYTAKGVHPEGAATHPLSSRSGAALQQSQSSQLLHQRQLPRAVTQVDLLTREKRRRRFSGQLKDLQQCYLSMRSNHTSQAQTQSGIVSKEALLHNHASNTESASKLGLKHPAAPIKDERTLASSAPSPQPSQQPSFHSSTAVDEKMAANADGEVATVADTAVRKPHSAAAWGGTSVESPFAVGAAPRKRFRTPPPEGLPLVTSGSEPNGLAEFSRMLSVFTHFGSLEVVAQVPRASFRQSSAILSSIEFDRDAQLFATAGVSKRICIFDFNRVMANPLETVHRPHAEVSTRSKLSCISWNRYLQSSLISSDYEGVVALWDVATGQQLSEYEAHQKRIWTVDFGHADPCHFVSGSDDGWVRVWSTHEQDCLLQMDLKANVCCVKYNPVVPHQIAVGCADHCVHMYDLRKADRAVSVLEGHKKAVAYVRFMGATEIVTASTDSTLRLWDLSTQACSRVYQGHANEKNFVGLSADGEFIACGSETNEMFVYYKSLSKPIAQRDFATPPVSASESQRAAAAGASESGHFISAVCWKPNTNTLLAANSSGVVSLCSLTHD